MTRTPFRQTLPVRAGSWAIRVLSRRYRGSGAAAPRGDAGGDGAEVLVHDHDAKDGPAFARVAAGSGIQVIRTPVRAPRANAVCERFLGRVRRECVDHTLILGERHLGRVLTECVGYVNRVRPHQGIGQGPPLPPAAVVPAPR